MTTRKVSTLTNGLIPWLTLALISLGGWLAYVDRLGSATICFTVGILMLLVANLDRIESFKGLGIEAKTRELKETISEAEQTNAELVKTREELATLAETLDTRIAELKQQMEDLEEKAEFAEAMAASFAHKNVGGL